MTLKRQTTLAMLIALNVVLCTLTPIKIQNFKFTFEAFPILVAAFLYGPIAGLTVGGIGTAIYQLLFSGYGITPTTILWILPHALSGLLVGYCSKHCNFNPSKTQTILICCASALLVTTLNTVALYADSKLYGYYSKKLVFAAIPFKIIAGVALAILFSLVIPKLLEYLKKIVK